MKKLYRGCIWVIILLPIMASQSVFATQTIQGKWEQTFLSNNVWEILGNNTREEIIESQYAFTLTSEAVVTARLTAFADTFVYLFLINSIGQLELVDRVDGTGTDVDSVYYGESVIQKTLSSGDYFIVPTTYSPETYSPPKAYILEITIVSVSGSQIPQIVTVNSDSTQPAITLNGEAVVSHELGMAYTDAAAAANDNTDGDISSSIVTTGEVNVQSPDTYTLTYNVSDSAGNAADPVARQVIVADRTKPVITLNGEAVVSHELGMAYTDAAAAANDNTDGDISSSIVTTGEVNAQSPDTYTLTYNVSDSAGNAADPVIRQVIVADRTKPAITLNGEAVVSHELGMAYTDAAAAANDNTDGDISSSIVTTGEVNAQSPDTYTLTYNVSDSAGNAADPVIRQVIVADRTKPAITLNGEAVVSHELGMAYTDAAAAANDNTDGDISSSIVTTGEVNVQSPDTYTLTYNVSDSAGNAADPVIRQVIVADRTKPAITLNGEAVVSHELGMAYTDAAAAANDNTDGDISSSIVTTGEVNAQSPDTYTLTYNVSDSAGNAADPVIRQVIVADRTKPAITLNGEAVVSHELGVAYTDAAAAANDNTDGDISSSIVTTGEVNAQSPDTYTLTYNVSDSASNAADPVIRQVIVADRTKPAITLNGEAVVSHELGMAYTDAAAAANDNTDGDISSSIVTTGEVNVQSPDTYTLTYNVSDSAGNAADPVIRQVIVADRTKPAITLNGEAVVSHELGVAYTDATAAANDNTDGDISSSIVTTGEVNAQSPDTYTLTYNVSDSAGNAADPVARQVIVADRTKPAITLNGEAVVSHELGMAYTDAAAAANDNTDGDISSSIVTTGEVNVQSPDTYTLTYNVSDSAGNAADPVARQVIVADRTKPVITLNGEAVVSHELGMAYTDAAAAANDNTDGDISSSIVTTGEVNVQSPDTYTLTYNVSDSAGNAADPVIRQVIVADRTKPVITLNGEAVVSHELGMAYTDAAAAANDNTDGDISSSIVTTGEVNVQSPDTYTLTYNVSDSAGNAADPVIRQVIVADRTKPAITLNGEAVVSHELGMAYTDAAAAANDNTDGDISSSIVTTGEVNVQSPDTYTLTYNVSDSAGNAADPVIRQVIVADRTKPVITLNGEAVVSHELGMAYTDAAAAANDNTDGDISSSIVTTGEVNVQSPDTYTLTYNVSDSAGNAADPVIRQVIVADRTKPAITLNGEAVVSHELGVAYTDAAAAANDNTDGDISSSIVTTGEVNAQSPDTYTLTYNVSDSASNAADPVIRQVIVADRTKPAITLNGEAVVSHELGMAYTDAAAAANDNTDGDISSSIVTTGEVNVQSPDTYTLTYNVSDSAGNAADPVARQVIVADRTKPVITLNGEAVVSHELGMAYTDAAAAANDNTDGDISSSIVTTGEVNVQSPDTYTLTYNVSDSAGNAADPVIRSVRVFKFLVTISGRIIDNEILSASNNFSDLGVISYQWQINGDDIPGATQSTYHLTRTDLSKVITVIAKYTDSWGNTRSVISNSSMEILDSALQQLAIGIVNNTSGLYVNAGILNVTDENIVSINDAVFVVGINTQSQVQQLVNSYIKILGFAGNNVSDAESPDYNNFIDIGILGIKEDSNTVALALLNDVISSGNTDAVDSISELQSFTDAVLALTDQAENASNLLNKGQLEILGVESVTDSNLADIRKIIADAGENLDQIEKIQILVNKVVASHVIQAYRNNIIDNRPPSLVNYHDLGLTKIDANNFEAINSAIVTLDPSSLDSLDKIVTLFTADSDSDEVIDLIDSFPLDSKEIADKDADTVGDNSDNCLNVANADQLDLDLDNVGDLCDLDKDGDGLENNIDNCPYQANADQLNIDLDTLGDICDTDKDNDEVENSFDNCPDIANADQLDIDNDSFGDICDADKDNDGVVNTSDNCPNIANPSQANFDADLMGDACDADQDNDGIVNSSDNCPNIVNPKQLNMDADSFGDICDTDKDNDEVENSFDNCPDISNPNQLDLDSDTVGDMCDVDKDNDRIKNNSDNCPNIPNTDQLDLDADSLGDVCDTDKDGDGLADNIDNCPNQANADQLDLDSDNIGDICDEDKDNDQVKNTTDNCPNVANKNQLDFDKDTIGDACDLDEDNDGIASVDDAFKLNAAYSKDTDGDGMADAYELEHGFDINNIGDKTTDSDGDGVSNIDEFLAGTDPRVNPSPGLPELVIPDDIQVISTGRMTAVDIGVATATDGSNVELQPVASYRGPFSAGRHEITWTATDSQGNQSKAVQVVKVLPLVNLTPSSLIAEGGEIIIRAVLSADAADYPVEIPYILSGTATYEEDYQIVQSNRQITIDHGREASFSIEVKVDDKAENNETIEITLDSATNAVLGSVTQRTITIVDGNLPPQITVQVEQGDNLGRVIAADKGEVIFTASVTDPNIGDTHQFDWQIEADQAPAVVSNEIQDNKNILIIDPSQLEPGIFSITAKANDSAEIDSVTEVKTDIKLMEVAPELSTEIDTDGDGVSDANEGYADSDNDGIVDYMDNIEESNLAPVSENSNAVLQAPVGTQLVLGEIAFANAKNSVLVSKAKVIEIITEQQLQLGEGIDDKDYDYPIGLYDFTISGAIPSRSYYLVIPLPVVIEEGQIFRKYMGSTIGWQNFVENAQNTLFSAKAVDGACPEPASRIYDYGLQPGNNCIQIYIEDGGPNDADGKPDGVVTDPAGIAVFNKQNEEIVSNQVEETPINQVEETPVNQVEETPINQVEETPVDQVEETPVDQVEETPVDQVEETPVDQVEETPVNQVEETPVNQVEETPVNQVEETPVDQVEETPVDQVEETPVDQVEETPVDQVEETPVDQVEETPVDQVEETPVDQVEETPVDQVEETPVNQVEETPVNQVEETPVNQVEETPVNQVEETPVSQVEETPVNQVEETPVSQVEETPVSQVEETPVNQVEETPVNQVEETPVDQVEENNIDAASAPSSSLSSVKLSQSVLYQKGDKAVITINALNNEGKLLDDVELSVKCIFCLGVEIGQFTQTKPGIYEATITSGRQISFGFIEAELTNEFGSAKLAPQKLNVVYRPSGGCTIAANGRTDISLFLMLILLTIYHRRKKL